LREDFARDHSTIIEERKQAVAGLQAAEQGGKLQDEIRQAAMQIGQARTHKDEALKQVRDFESWSRETMLTAVRWLVGLAIFGLLIWQLRRASRTRGVRRVVRL